VEGFVNVTPTVMMMDYISFVMKMLIAFGIIFQIPIVSSFLALTGLLTHHKLLRWMRYYIFGAFLASAILTPPDFASMFIMAIPAIALYFVSIVLVYIFQRKDAVNADLEAQREKQEEKQQAEKLAAEKKR
jgi:sec-independent protein translocase protein TatC